MGIAQLSQYNGFCILGGRKDVFGRHKRGNFDDVIFKHSDMEPWGEMKEEKKKAGLGVKPGTSPIHEVCPNR